MGPTLVPRPSIIDRAPASGRNTSAAQLSLSASNTNTAESPFASLASGVAVSERGGGVSGEVEPKLNFETNSPTPDLNAKSSPSVPDTSDVSIFTSSDIVKHWHRGIISLAVSFLAHGTPGPRLYSPYDLLQSVFSRRETEPQPGISSLALCCTWYNIADKLYGQIRFFPLWERHYLAAESFFKHFFFRNVSNTWTWCWASCGNNVPRASCAMSGFAIQTDRFKRTKLSSQQPGMFVLSFWLRTTNTLTRKWQVAHHKVITITLSLSSRVPLHPSPMSDRSVEHRGGTY